MNPRWLNRRVAKPGPYLTLVLSEQELAKVVKKLSCDPLSFPTSGAVCHTLWNKDDEVTAVVAVSISAQNNTTAIEMAGLLIHEAVHVWQVYAAESINEKNPSSEQEAYAIQGISQELLAEYARRISK